MSSYTIDGAKDEIQIINGDNSTTANIKQHAKPANRGGEEEVREEEKEGVSKDNKNNLKVASNGNEDATTPHEISSSINSSTTEEISVEVPTSSTDTPTVFRSSPNLINKNYLVHQQSFDNGNGENDGNMIESALLGALQDPRERHGLLRLEQTIINFMQTDSKTIEIGGACNSMVVVNTPDAGKHVIQEPLPGRQTSFQRLLLHRLADRFNILRENSFTIEEINSTPQPYGPGLIRLIKTEQSRIPNNLLMHAQPHTNMPTQPPQMLNPSTKQQYQQQLVYQGGFAMAGRGVGGRVDGHQVHPCGFYSSVPPSPVTSQQQLDEITYSLSTSAISENTTNYNNDMNTAVYSNSTFLPPQTDGIVGQNPPIIPEAITNNTSDFEGSTGGPTIPPKKMMVLKRSTSNASASNKCSKHSNSVAVSGNTATAVAGTATNPSSGNHFQEQQGQEQKPDISSSLTDREKAYEEARARIFAKEVLHEQSSVSIEADFVSNRGLSVNGIGSGAVNSPRNNEIMLVEDGGQQRVNSKNAIFVSNNLYAPTDMQQQPQVLEKAAVLVAVAKRDNKGHSLPELPAKLPSYKGEQCTYYYRNDTGSGHNRDERKCIPSNKSGSVQYDEMSSHCHGGGGTGIVNRQHRGHSSASGIGSAAAISKVTWRNRLQERNDPDFRRQTMIRQIHPPHHQHHHSAPNSISNSMIPPLSQVGETVGYFPLNMSMAGLRMGWGSEQHQHHGGTTFWRSNSESKSNMALPATAQPLNRCPPGEVGVRLNDISSHTGAGYVHHPGHHPGVTANDSTAENKYYLQQQLQQCHQPPPPQQQHCPKKIYIPSKQYCNVLPRHHHHQTVVSMPAALYKAEGAVGYHSAPHGPYASSMQCLQNHQHLQHQQHRQQSAHPSMHQHQPFAMQLTGLQPPMTTNGNADIGQQQQLPLPQQPSPPSVPPSQQQMFHQQVKPQTSMEAGGCRGSQGSGTSRGSISRLRGSQGSHNSFNQGHHNQQ